MRVDCITRAGFSVGGRLSAEVDAAAGINRRGPLTDGDLRRLRSGRSAEIDRGRGVGWRDGTFEGRSARVEPVEGIDESSQPDPPQAVLLAVLDPADHRLIDTAVGLETSLRPAQRLALSSDLRTQQVETALLLRVSRKGVPCHRPDPSEPDQSRTYLPIA